MLIEEWQARPERFVVDRYAGTRLGALHTAAVDGISLVSRSRDNRRGGDKTMGDVVDRDTEAFKRPHAKQDHVARLGEYYFVDGLVALRGDDGKADLALHFLLSRRGEEPLAARRDAGGPQEIGGQPGEFRTCVDERLHGRGRTLLMLGIDG